MMEIELVRGTRRRKHIEAVLVGDRLRVSFPRWMTREEAESAAAELALMADPEMKPRAVTQDPGRGMLSLSGSPSN